MGASTGLDLYFDRIVYRGRRTPERAVLDAIVRAHIAAIPFENIDIQLGRPISHDLPAIFDKLVVRRRGGWCYEQNSLIGWALAGLGFTVRRIAGGVMRSTAGDAVIGNHLALIVTLDGADWLVDVGFGGSLAGPIPLAEAWHDHGPYEISLKHVDGGMWRFEEWISGNPVSWDFSEAAADERLFALHQHRLQSDPASSFVKTLVVQHRQGDAHLTLRGRVLTSAGPRGQERQLLHSGSEMVAVLARRFDLSVPEIAAIWPKIDARHRALFGL